MEIRKGERWRCQNRSCQAEILVRVSSEVPDGRNPRCSCGQVMKKPYVPPEITTGPLTREIEQRLQLPASPPLEILAARRAHHNNG